MVLETFRRKVQAGSKKVAMKAARTVGSAAHRQSTKALKKLSSSLNKFPNSKVAGALRERLPEPDPEPPRGIFYVAHLLLELFQRAESRSIFVLPGGVSFFFLLAIFPAAASVASIYGLLSNAQDLIAFSEQLKRYVPTPFAALINDVLTRVSQASDQSLGVSAIVGLFFTLMTANWGTKALCESLNIIFDRRDMRSYLEFTSITLIMTTTTVIIIAAYAWLTIRIFGSGTLPGVVDQSNAPGLWIEGLILWAVLTAMIGTIYRYGPAPDLTKPPPGIFTIGACLAALGVIIASWLLARQFMTSDTFVRNFGALSSVAAIVIWCWILVVIILIGAELVVIRQEERLRGEIRRRRWWRKPSW